MAFETKVGLLVGMGFIVCFAVVLSHRGRGDQISAHMAYRVLSEHGRGKPTRTTTIPNEFVRPLVRVSAGFPSAPERDAPQRGNGIAKTVAKPTVGSEAPTWESLFGESEKEGRARVSGGLPNEKPGLLNDKSGLPNEKSPDRSPAKRKVRSGDAEPPGPSETKVVRYVVEPRDTLWGVAEKAYGKPSRTIVDAIFETNRDRLASMDKLQVGMELVLPLIEGQQSPRAAGDKPGRPQEETKPAAEQQHRYYEVRQGDRYATIAERFLGDKSRWREIHELNRDIFPNPGRIQYGVRIRIPLSISTSEQ